MEAVFFVFVFCFVCVFLPFFLSFFLSSFLPSFHSSFLPCFLASFLFFSFFLSFFLPKAHLRTCADLRGPARTCDVCCAVSARQARLAQVGAQSGGLAGRRLHGHQQPGGSIADRSGLASARLVAESSAGRWRRKGMAQGSAQFGGQQGSGVDHSFSFLDFLESTAVIYIYIYFWESPLYMRG